MYQLENTTLLTMTISIGNDHAGPDYKTAIVNYLKTNGHTVINHGTDTFDSVDYPDFGHPVAYDVESKKSRSWYCNLWEAVTEFP